MEIKTQGNRRGGLVMLIFGIICLTLTVTTALIFANSLTGFYSGSDVGLYGPFPLPVLFTAFGMGAISLIPIIVGLVFFIKGSKYASIQKKGRKSECRIHNILHTKSSYDMIVNYRGESGKEYFHAVTINYQYAATLKPGMVVECYILKEDCYIDEAHINVLTDEEI